MVAAFAVQTNALPEIGRSSRRFKKSYQIEHTRRLYEVYRTRKCRKHESCANFFVKPQCPQLAAYMTDNFALHQSVWPVECDHQ